MGWTHAKLPVGPASVSLVTNASDCPAVGNVSGPKRAVGLTVVPATYTLVPRTATALAKSKSVPPIGWTHVKPPVGPASVILATNASALRPALARVVAPKRAVAP